MACRICGRSSCIESFHSIDEQERFDARERIADELAELRERAETAERERNEARERVAELEAALDAIRQYGSDTLSGRADGPDDRDWQRAAVEEMTRRADKALKGGA
jgi:predicted  nucleic acid-binding Zn-ribbon protein